MRFSEAYRALAERCPPSVRVAAAGSLRGTVTAPPSKSYTHRALMVAGLGEGAVVRDPLLCADTAHTATLWEELGAALDWDPGERLLTVRGFAGRPRPVSATLEVGEAGTLFRLVLPGLALVDGTTTLGGDPSFERRSNGMIVAPLRELGVDARGQGGDLHRAPVVVRGTGRIRPGTAHVPGGQSSQPVSGLLLWLPLAEPGPGDPGASEIVVDGTPVSQPYVEMTREVQAWAGVRSEVLGPGRWRVPAGQRYASPAEPYAVPGDWSGAAFPLAAACLVESDLTVTGLREDGQGDRAIVGILERMGARPEPTGAGGIRIRGPVELQAVEVDCADTPDLVPVLCALAAHARGTTALVGLHHLRNKESDRIEAPARELRRLGVEVRTEEARIEVVGRPGAWPELTARVDSHNDHRIAMALAVAALPGGGVEIADTRSVLKSYPTFFEDLASVGARWDRPHRDGAGPG